MTPQQGALWCRVKHNASGRFSHGIFSKYIIFSWNIHNFRNYRVIKRIWNEFSFHTVFMKLGDIKHTTSFINTVWNENSFQILYSSGAIWKWSQVLWTVIMTSDLENQYRVDSLLHGWQECQVSGRCTKRFSLHPVHNVSYDIHNDYLTNQSIVTIFFPHFLVGFFV